MENWAEKAGKLVIGRASNAPIEVNRLGYGTMRLTGPGVWGEPADRSQALQILKKAVASGVNFLDTADYYGRDITNRLIVEALHPYPADLIICTKVGATRGDDKSWLPYATPDNLRASIDANLRTMKLEQMAVVHFRMMPHNPVPFEESLDAMFELQKEGKIRHVGLSNVRRKDLEKGLERGPIATVENLYSYTQRTTFTAHGDDNPGGEEVLPLCEQHQIPLIPFFSLLTALPAQENRVSELAQKYGVTNAQMNLAWLLHKSPWLLPIPGTSSLDHLAENLAAASISLTDEDMAYLG